MDGRTRTLEEAAASGREDDQAPSGLRRGSLALIGAALLALALVAGLAWADHNSGRYEIRCARGWAEPRQGLFFLWGTKHIDDEAHARLDLPDGVSCANARFSRRADLDAAFATLLLESAEQRVASSSPNAIARAREELERATRLNGLTGEQRRRAEALLADMVYQEAREILRQVEVDLWQARRKLERARGLGAGDRIRDLDDWLEFVEAETERFRPSLSGASDARSPESRARPGESADGGADGGSDAAPRPEDVFL